MNIEKLVQATGYLLKKYNNRRLNYTKLIKELYLADRAAIAASNSSITGDSFFCMKHGPVLGNVYSLIKGKYREPEQSYWNVRFSVDGNELLANFDQFPEGKLSKAEKEILDRIDGQYYQKTFGQMIDIVHEICPEWKDPGNTSVPLKLEDILTALQRTPEEIEWILEEAAAFEAEDRIFSSLAAEG